MRLKYLVVAGAAAAFMSGAYATDVSQNVPLMGSSADGFTAGFTITHMDGPSFTDSITFTGSTGKVMATSSLVTINLGVGQNIDFASVKLNNQDLKLSGPGFFETAYTPSAFTVDNPLVLTVMGTTDAGGGKNATYSGTMNVAAVPEPETYALMLAGLGAIGFMARRRRGT